MAVVEKKHNFHDFTPNYEVSSLTLRNESTHEEAPTLPIVLYCLKGSAQLKSSKSEEITLKHRCFAYIPSGCRITLKTKENATFIKYQEMFDKCMHKEHDPNTPIIIRTYDNRTPFMTLNGVDLIDDMHPVYAKEEEDFPENVGPAISSCFGRMKIGEGKEISQRWATNVLMQLVEGEMATVTIIDEEKNQKTLTLTEGETIEIPSESQWKVENNSNGEIQVMNILHPFWKNEYSRDLF